MARPPRTSSKSALWRRAAARGLGFLLPTDLAILIAMWATAALLLALVGGCATDGMQRTLQSVSVYGEHTDGDERGVFSNDTDTVGVAFNPFAGVESNSTRLERMQVEKLEREGFVRDPVPTPAPAPANDVDWATLGTAIGTLGAAVLAVAQRERITKLVRRKSGKEA